MVSYLVLGSILFVAWIVIFVSFDKELLSPASLIALVMLMATVLAGIGLASWNKWPLSPVCIILILTGVLSFAIGSTISKRISFRAKHWSSPIDKIKRVAEPSNWKLCILCVILAFAICIHVYETIKIAASAGIDTSDYSQAALWVRNHTNTYFSNGAISFTAGYSILDRLLQKVSSAVGVICTVSGILAFRKRNRTTFALSAACVMLSMALPLSGGNRGGIFTTVIAVFLGCFIVALRTRGRNHSASISTKFGITLVAIAVIGGISFYLLGSLVGRSASASPVEYLTFYLGCGLPGFERILTEGGPQYNLPFFNTFYEQYNFLYKFGIVDQLPESSSYWLSMGNFGCNVFTFVFAYFMDFGIAGVVFFPILSGFVYTFLYERTFRKNMNPASLAMFLYIGSELFDIERASKLFTTLFTANTLLTLLIIALIGAWLFAPKRYRIGNSLTDAFARHGTYRVRRIEANPQDAQTIASQNISHLGAFSTNFERSG